MSDVNFTFPSVALKALSFTGLETVDDYAAFWAPDLNRTLDEWHGGTIEESVADHLTRRCCSVPDVGAAGGMEEARWPDDCSQKLRIRLDWSGWNSSKMNMTSAEATRQYARALDDWEKAVNLRWDIVTSGPVNCTVDIGNLSGNTLAWSHLANNRCSTDFQQRYDIRRWPSPQYFYLVVLHECGHLLGLPHTSGHYIMNPSIISSLTGLTEADKRRGRELGYGAPSPADPPTGPRSKIVIPDTAVFMDGVKAGTLKFVPENGGGDGPVVWEI